MTTIRAIGRAMLAATAVLLSGCPSPDRDPTGPDAEPLVITTAALPNAVLGVPYSAGIDAEGGDGEYQWDLQSGALPSGVTLSVEDLTDDDIVLTGIPEETGTFAFVLRVESDDGQVRTRSFQLTVLEQPSGVVIESVVVAPALVGASYDTQLRASGGDGTTYTWTIESGTLPAGLVLEPTGRLRGTPTVADTAALVMRVQSGEFESSQSYLLQVVANRTGTYDITIAPVVPIPTAFVSVVDAAIARWQAAIVGDLPQRSINVGTFEPGQCGGFGPVVNGTSADDIIVLVNIGQIDGRGSVLGFAGPCLIRSPGNLPIVGVLTLDAVDLGFLNTDAQIALVTHEIGHALGFGSMWETFGLITSSTTDPRYLGSSANAQWNALGGSGQAPVENQGGEGTARSHWRESTFGRELMTGFSNTSVFQPLSRMTIASFGDLGYTVNLNAADAFSLSAPMGAAQLERAIDEAAGYDVVYDGIVGRVDALGRVTPRESQ